MTNKEKQMLNKLVSDIWNELNKTSNKQVVGSIENNILNILADIDEAFNIDLT